MKRIGIIGGMSYESTLHYYEEINRRVNREAGRLNSADLVIRSVNFEEYHQLMMAGRWDEIAKKLSFEALDLVLKHKCDYVAIATNTMHKVADIVSGPHTVVDNIWPQTETPVEVPLIHIGDCIAAKCIEAKAKRVLLLGTKFTMTENFLKDRLAEYDIETIDLSGRPDVIDEIDRIIFEELCKGAVTEESLNYVLNFILRLPTDSASAPDAIVLGCTELCELITAKSIMLTNGTVPVIDSTATHIEKIVELCLSE